MTVSNNECAHIKKCAGIVRTQVRNHTLLYSYIFSFEKALSHWAAIMQAVDKSAAEFLSFWLLRDSVPEEGKVLHNQTDAIWTMKNYLLRICISAFMYILWDSPGTSNLVQFHSSVLYHQLFMDVKSLPICVSSS